MAVKGTGPLKTVKGQGGLWLSGDYRHLAEPDGLSTIGGVCPAIVGQMWRLRRGNCVE